MSDDKLQAQAIAIVSLIAFGSIVSILATHLIDVNCMTRWDRTILISIVIMGAIIPIRFLMGDSFIMKTMIILSSLSTLILMILKSGGMI